MSQKTPAILILVRSRSPLRKALPQRARNDGHLVPVKKQVHGKSGGVYEQIKWVKPEDAKKMVRPGAAFQVKDAPGVHRDHANKMFTIDRQHESQPDHWHVTHEDGSKAVVSGKHIMQHATPVEGHNQGRKAEAPKRQWVDKLEHLPEDTSEHWKQMGNGEYPPERKKLHEKIIASYLDHVLVPRPGVPKEALFMAGGTAAGKSTILNLLMDKDTQKNFVVVDPDSIKEHIPEYQEATGKSAKNAAFMVHEESSDIADEIKRRALEQGKHIIVDGTLKNFKKYHSMMEDMKKKGYKLNIIMVDTDVSIAKQSAASRAERTGRHVPHDIIEDIYPKARASFLKLKDMADDYQVYDRRGESPSLVWDKKNGVHNHEKARTIFGEHYANA